MQSLRETVNDLKQHVDNSLIGIQMDLKEQLDYYLQQNQVTNLDKIQDNIWCTTQMMDIHDLKMKQEELDKK